MKISVAAASLLAASASAFDKYQRMAFLSNVLWVYSVDH